MRSPEQISKEEYADFYKSLTNDLGAVGCQTLLCWGAGTDSQLKSQAKVPCKSSNINPAGLTLVSRSSVLDHQLHSWQILSIPWLKMQLEFKSCCLCQREPPLICLMHARRKTTSSSMSAVFSSWTTVRSSSLSTWVLLKALWTLKTFHWIFPEKCSSNTRSWRYAFQMSKCAMGVCNLTLQCSNSIWNATDWIVLGSLHLIVRHLYVLCKRFLISCWYWWLLLFWIVVIFWGSR